MTTRRTPRPHYIDQLRERVERPEPADSQLALVSDLGRRASQAGRGTSFERMIERAHQSYRIRRTAIVERNKRVWDYTSEKRALLLPKFMAARTLDGRHYLVMETSLVDYAGTARGRSIRFDAKETAEASIPLKNLSREQVEELCNHEAAGALAGFMVLFTRTGEVFFVAAIAVRDAQDRVLFQAGKGKHPKSLSLDWMKEHALHVYTVRHEGDMCDYLPKLLGAEQ